MMIMEMLSPVTVILGYGVVVGGLVFVLLFGQWDVFAKTPVSWLHWFITSGALEYITWLIERVGGQRAVHGCGRLEDVCCNQRNPSIQILYVLILSFTFFLFYTSILIHLPSPTMAGYHMYTGSLIAMLCLFAFILGSLSDPGTITKENLETHLSAFPFDDVLFSEKKCSTCEFNKPARSKHCSVCKKCVARHDHHCAWLNNCVGLNNHRYFLLFLATNLLATLYGSLAIPVFIYGKITGILHHPFIDPETGKLFTLANRPWRLMEYISVRFTVLFALFFCTMILCLLLVGFLGYHLYLIAIGQTTNESFKWSDLSKAARVEQASTVKWWKGPKLPDNVYDNGLIANFTEVMFPSSVFNRKNKHI